MLCSLFVAAAALVPADLVIDDARIWSDGQAEFAEFAAVRGGQFVWVGPRREEYIGPNTVVVDADGRVVVPGLIDSHIHMLNGGQSLTAVHLRDARNKQEFIEALREYAEAHPDRAWITGGRWSTESWADTTEPTRQWLDQAVPDRPVFLSRMDGHSAVVNTKALEIAGVTAGTPAPAGGIIERDNNGNPTGLLRENATGLVSMHIPTATLEEDYQSLLAAMAEANKNGITAVSDVSAGSRAVDLYGRAASEGRLTLRAAIYPGPRDDLGRLTDWFPTVPNWLFLRGIKAYADGSIGSRTAYMAAPFLNIPADSDHPAGLPMPELLNGEIASLAERCKEADLQLIVHAIGDQANSDVIDLFVATWGEDVEEARPRIEHAQHLLPADILRFGELGVIPSMQPFHKADDGRYAEDFIGLERSRSSYAFKPLLESGAKLAFGSDWPVVTVNPFLGIKAAVTGRTLNGEVWIPENNLTVAEALRCYTTNGAYAMFMEGALGRIAQGYKADFVILSESPFDEDVDWDSLHAVATFVAGREVWRGE